MKLKMKEKLFKKLLQIDHEIEKYGQEDVLTFMVDIIIKTDINSIMEIIKKGEYSHLSFCVLPLDEKRIIIEFY